MSASVDPTRLGKLHGLASCKGCSSAARWLTDTARTPGTTEAQAAAKAEVVMVSNGTVAPVSSDKHGRHTPARGTAISSCRAMHDPRPTEYTQGYTRLAVCTAAGPASYRSYDMRSQRRVPILPELSAKSLMHPKNVDRATFPEVPLFCPGCGAVGMRIPPSPPVFLCQWVGCSSRI